MLILCLPVLAAAITMLLTDKILIHRFIMLWKEGIQYYFNIYFDFLDTPKFIF
jgi:heme/copper-type cytochrome/quinol oxidase subunit 1